MQERCEGERADEVIATEEFREEQDSQSIKPEGDVQKQARSETPSVFLYPEKAVLIRAR